MERLWAQDSGWLFVDKALKTPTEEACTSQLASAVLGRSTV